MARKPQRFLTMKFQNITPGDTVYNLQGHAAVVSIEHPTEPGFLVYPLYETYHGDDERTERGPLAHWPQVYEQVPTIKKSEEIVKLDEEIEKKKLDLFELNQTRYEIQRTQKVDTERLAKLSKQSSALCRLESFLEGGITHYVKSDSWDWQDSKGRELIITEAFSEKCSDKYSRDLKLLTLYGKSSGDLEWRLSQYSDGSSSSYKLVWPFCSLEEATEFAQKKTEEQLEFWRFNPSKNSEMMSFITANLKRFSMEIPEDLILHSEGKKKAAKLAVLQKAKEAFEKAQADFEALSSHSVKEGA